MAQTHPLNWMDIKADSSLSTQQLAHSEKVHKTTLAYIAIVHL